MPLTISREQRDAIYELVVDHLTGIGDVWIEFHRRDFATAKRQAREFVEDLHLLNDLGWDETVEVDTVALTVPTGELVCTLARLHRAATGAPSAYLARPEDDGAVAERNLTAVVAIGELLAHFACASHGANSTSETWNGGSR